MVHLSDRSSTTPVSRTRSTSSRNCDSRLLEIWCEAYLLLFYLENVELKIARHLAADRQAPGIEALDLIHRCAGVPRKHKDIDLPIRPDDGHVNCRVPKGIEAVGETSVRIEL
jgi:hypothetical protein